MGKFLWYMNTAFNNLNSSSSSTPSGTPQFGVLEPQIRQTSLVNSLDLDAYFNIGEERELYKNPGNGPMSPQRLINKAMARNRTLNVLIEELSFNISIGLM